MGQNTHHVDAAEHPHRPHRRAALPDRVSYTLQGDAQTIATLCYPLVI
jgi:hypothetical protein